MGGDAKIDTNKDVDKKGKLVSEFQKLDLANGLKVDILNENRYEDPYVVDGILTGALTDGMKSKTKRMSHLQRLVGLKQETLMVRFHSYIF